MKDYLFCIDSDGCAMDTMTYKHKLYFGPIAAEIFEIEDVELFKEKWNKTNLYSKDRGINRFLGLLKALEEFNVSNIDNFRNWVNNTKSFSNLLLEKEIEKNPSQDLIKALKWSNQVNLSIKNHQEKALSFKGVKETLKKLNSLGSVYVVSSANKEAVIDEFEKEEISEYIEEFYCQDSGKKEEIIKKLIDKGADKNKIIMIGDSIGDLKAAQLNTVSFFPILVNKEVESWQKLLLFSEEFINRGMSFDKQSELEKEFIENFKN